MKDFLYFITIIFVWGCTETTGSQSTVPIVDVSKVSIPADGESSILISIELDRQPHPDQEMSISTTEGLLLTIPRNEDSPLGQNILTIKPNRRKLDIQLVSGITASDEVKVFVVLNDFVEVENLEFTNNTANELFTSLSKDSLKIGTADFIDLQIVLRSAKGTPSLDQRISLVFDFEMTPISISDGNGGQKDSLVEVNDLVLFDETIFSSNDTLTTQLKSKILSFPDERIKQVNAQVQVMIEGVATSTQKLKIIK